MKKAVKKSGSSRIFALTAAVIFGMAAASCGRRLEPCYVEIPASAKPVGDIQVNYFFDRTESVGGFVQSGKETGYVTAIYSALETAETLKYGTLAFYEFGESVTSRLSFSTTDMLKEIQKKNFYGTNPSKVNRTTIRENKGQPFSSIAEHIRDNETGNLNIVVTDLYEQAGINRYFHLLFQNAFDQGLAGAIFAVKSEFKGNIYSISSADESLRGIDGYSTFFILMTGNRSYIREYCAELSKQFTQKNLTFDRTLLIPGESANDDRGRINYTKENDSARFTKTSIVNLTRKEGLFKRWVKIKNEYAGVQVNVESYVPGPPAEAQFVYRIRSRTDTASVLPVPRDMTAAYFNGGKTTAGSPSPFKDVPSAGLFDQPAAFQDRTDKYISIKIHTKQLDRGYYRVRFNIVPDWVIAGNAGSVAELKESNAPGERIKVLNLRLIYENILNEFAKVGGYSENFYIVKN